jgi:hypothetical protein
MIVKGISQGDSILNFMFGMFKITKWKETLL